MNSNKTQKMIIAQRGRKLLQEASQDISFGSIKKDIFKKFKTNCILKTWKDEDMRNSDKIYKELYKKYVKEYYDLEAAMASANAQATKAAFMANKYHETCHNIVSKMKKKSKKNKYNLTVRANFDDWEDFTEYIENEKNKMKNKPQKKYIYEYFKKIN